jgi:hypothetical protein
MIYLKVSCDKESEAEYSPVRYLSTNSDFTDCFEPDLLRVYNTRVVSVSFARTFLQIYAFLRNGALNSYFLSGYARGGGGLIGTYSLVSGNHSIP